MPKKQEEFLNLSFEELTKIIERTFETLKSLGWETRSKEQKEDKMRWVVKIPNKLLPGYSFLIDLLAGAYHKVLIIEVSANKVLAECKEETAGYVIDWLGEKKRILDEFFLHLDSMLRSGTLYKGKMVRRYGLITKLSVVLLIASAIIGILAFQELLLLFKN